MYTQIFLVTSVRGRVLAPQIFASASLSFFKVAFVIVVFVVVATVVFVVVVIAIEGRKC